MGLGIETLKKSFPKTDAALKKLFAVVDKHIESPAARQDIKTHAYMVASAAAVEAGELGKRADNIGSALSLLGTVLRRKP